MATNTIRAKQGSRKTKASSSTTKTSKPLKSSSKKSPTTKYVAKKSLTKKIPSKSIISMDSASNNSSSASSANKPIISSSGHQLVIVESPAKAKTISKFLGSNYDVRASMGHVIELEDRNMEDLVAKKFIPNYQVMEGKQKVVKELKSLAKHAGQVWIATDEDREGEAIGWHLTKLLGLNESTTPRIVFHEITKQAINHAIENPRTIDMNLVHAQQGRSVLDKLVGFTLSPLLWKKIKTGLSAGRVQSVAVELIVEREREIQAFKPEESRSAHAHLDHASESLEVDLHSISGKAANMLKQSDFIDLVGSLGLGEKEFSVQKAKKADTIVLESASKLPFVLESIQTKEGSKTPSAPFTTSTLQQTASRMFGRGVKQVMSVAQKLYEHGHITYMRTDSTNLSAQALAAAKSYVQANHGDAYHQFRQYKGKSKNAQEAHEAIRPTHLDRTPETSGLSAQELRLYDLIRRRTLATQMANAKVMNTTYHFSLQHTSRVAKGQVVTFDGFLAIYPNTAEDVILPAISPGSTLTSSSLRGEQHWTKPPARYTEASLVKELEKKGIGRPSTYAPTISTIQDRGYVIKDDNKKLKPTEIAMVVTDYLIRHVPEIMDYEFTAHLEEKLDHVAAGQTPRQQMLSDFYNPFAKTVKEATGAEREYTKIGKKCPQCKDGDLVIKFSKNSSFVGCNRYPDCDYAEESDENKDILGPLKAKYEGQPCPEGGTIVVRLGRFGPFLSSSLYPQVKWISPIPDPKKDWLEKTVGGSICDVCKQGTLTIKKKRGKPRQGELPYFLACNRYPDCKNASSLKLSKEQLEELSAIS